jgi:HlyD family secretion protein
MRRHVQAGIAVSALLLFGFGAWAAGAQLAGAVITRGLIVVESYAKKVQHPTGGVVRAIRVREGSAVTAGEVLVSLDDTQTRANLAVITRSLDELQVRRERLAAERDGAATLDFPAELAARAKSDPEVDKIASGERTLFEARRTARGGQKSQLAQRIGQLQQDIGGLDAQLQAKAQEIALVRQELGGVEALYRKNLVPITRLSALQREAARLDGDRGRLISGIAEAKGRISEIELQIIQVDQDLRTEVLKEQRDIDAKIDELVQRKVAASDQLAHVELRSPQDGVVTELHVHTVGGVINPGEVVMLIIPQRDRLLAEVKVAPQDVDQISPGQKAALRFAAFDQRTTPELFGAVETISADLVRDQQASLMGEQAYYVARIAIPDSEIGRLTGLKLVPGMPVEAHVQTGERSALSYLIRPLADQLNRAFREP